MRSRLLALVFAICPALAISQVQTETFRTGSDTFIAGHTVLSQIDSPGDVFVAAETASLGGTSVGDLHVAGFDVSVNTDVAEDLYAAGATVILQADVARDTTAIGFTLRTAPTAEMARNVRLAGNTVTIEGPISGALSVIGRTVILNAPVLGDARITARTLTFGEKSRVDGTLSYSTPAPVAVPERVAGAARIYYTEIDFDADWEAMRDTFDAVDMPVFPSAASAFGAFLISLLFFMLLGALALGFMPRQLERMRLGIALAPGRSMLLGVIGLSLLFGLLPILAMTIVGLPLLPVVVLVVIVTWTLGYALGGYAVAMKIWTALGGEDDPASVVRVLVLAAAVTAVALLNFIPFIGWVANFTLVLLGIGAITRLALARFITDIDPALDLDMKPASD